MSSTRDPEPGDAADILASRGASPQDETTGPVFTASPIELTEEASEGTSAVDSGLVLVSFVDYPTGSPDDPLAVPGATSPPPPPAALPLPGGATPPGLALAAWEMAHADATDPPPPWDRPQPDEPACLSLGQTATPRFWTGPNGQALIRQFNGGPAATLLGDWLAASFPRLYGGGPGPHSLAGKSNADIAGVVRDLNRDTPEPASAQVLATALSIYATTRSLGGTEAAAYGFRISRNGVAACWCSVAASGRAFGVANGSTLRVGELLQALDRRSPQGVLLDGDPDLLAQARSLLDLLNQFGDIDG